MSFTLTDKHRVRIRETKDFWLATVKTDASAHLVPIWAVLVDDLFYMFQYPLRGTTGKLDHSYSFFLMK